MNVEDIMTKEPVACDVQDPIRHAARLMRDKGVGCIVGLRNDTVAGILTDRDVCLAFAEERDDETVEEVMTMEVGRLNPDDSVFHAVDVFRSAGVVRRLPVVNRNDQLVGLLSIADLAVVAQDLNQAIYLEETHNALDDARIMTGAKEFSKVIRRPTKEGRLPPPREARPVGPATLGTAKSGRGSA